MSSKCITHLLRGSLSTRRGLGSYHLPIRKLVLRYSESNLSSLGMRGFLRSQVACLASSHPTIEVVVQQSQNETLHPLVTGLYVNGGSKEICVRGLQSNGVGSVVEKVIQSSGARIKSLKRKPVVHRGQGSARGVWSSVHSEVDPI